MRTFLIATLSAATLALGGCGTINRSVDSIKQPVVTRTDYVFDAALGSNGLVPAEADRVAGWLASMQLHYGDHVAVDDPQGNATAKAQIAAMAARYGMMLDDRAPITTGVVNPGTVRVVITRATATVPGCPDFTRNGSSEFQGSTTSNYGCATNASLAAMVANPLDLVRGQPGTEDFDPNSSGRAIGAYRAASPTGGGGTVVKSEGTGSK